MMPIEPSALLGPPLPDASVAEAAHVRELVAAVDAVGRRDPAQPLSADPGLADPGLTDAEIAPLRPRLATLRQKRPLRLLRVMMQPLDPLIVRPSRWYPGSVGVPRSALPLFGTAVVAELGPRAAAFAARMHGHASDEVAAVAAIGAELWPLAAEALRRAGVPGNWEEETGLHRGEFAPLAQAAAVLLAEGSALLRLAQPHPDPDERALCGRLLADAAARGPQPLAMMLAALLARLPHAGHVLQRACDIVLSGSEAARLAPDRAVDFLLSEGAEAATRRRTPGGGVEPETVDDLRQVALLLHSVAANGRGRGLRLARQVRLNRLQQSLDKDCRERFAAEALELQPPADAEADDASVAALEATARHLRRFEALARRFGGGPFYDGVLRETAQRLSAAAGLRPMDKLRLAEILLGPDAALALTGADISAR